LAIPTALLRRFYVGQSLRNNEDGIEFRLANHIAPTTILALGPIEVDGRLFAPDDIIVRSSKPRPASAIREKAPLILDIAKEVAISVPGIQLPPGRHHIVVHALTKEVGPVSIEFDETLT